MGGKVMKREKIVCKKRKIAGGVLQLNVCNARFANKKNMKQSADSYLERFSLLLEDVSGGLCPGLDYQEACRKLSVSSVLLDEWMSATVGVDGKTAFEACRRHLPVDFVELDRQFL